MNEERDLWSAGFELGLLTERDRIIKLLLETREGLDAILAAEFDSGEQLEALIKREDS